MFGLLGPNGAGKTSTIRMIVGITMPDSGQVRLFGQPFSRDQLGLIGYLPEERGLYKKMKVLDQLVFMGQIRGLDVDTARTRAQYWCERLAISDVMEKKTEELSKGMQQKIQFISTLLHDPKFLIMDEPFSGLDPVNAALLQDTLLDLRREGKAILFSTHRMDQVEKLCDSICLVNGGQAVLSGSMREIKSRYPRNRMLLEFEGEAGFLADPVVASSTEEVKNYGRRAELKLKPGADAQALLRHFMQSTVVLKYELVEPSLEEIFIQTVGGSTNA
jgi:ABC-2 type transport system ATP-binding protein